MERGTLAVCIREVQRTLAQSSKRLIETKRNGPRRLVLRPLYICDAGDSAYVQKSGYPANQNFITFSHHAAF